MWSWLYEVKPLHQKHCRKPVSLPCGPDTLQSCCSTEHRCSHSPCAEMNSVSKSSRGSRIWSCVPACSRSRLPSCSCFCNRHQWKLLHFQPTLPPSNSAQPSQPYTAPEPNWWSDRGGRGRAAALSAWSLFADHQRRINKGWLCSDPRLNRYNLHRGDQYHVIVGNHQKYRTKSFNICGGSYIYIYIRKNLKLRF